VKNLLHKAIGERAKNAQKSRKKKPGIKEGPTELKQKVPNRDAFLANSGDAGEPLPTVGGYEY